MTQSRSPHRGGAVLVAGVSGVLCLTGCGKPELLDPTDAGLLADRARRVERMTDGLLAVGDQLGAGPALATRVDTWCYEGADDWKYQALYRSKCEVAVQGGFALEVGLSEAVGGLDGLRTFEEQLATEGWRVDGWEVARNDPGIGMSLDEIEADGLAVTDVLGVRMYSEGDGTELGVGFRSGSAPVEASYGPPGGYYTDNLGEDWQPVWNAQRHDHTLLVTVYAQAILAEHLR